MAKDIRSKDSEIYYYSCILVDELDRLEKFLKEQHEELLKHFRFRYVLSIKDKLNSAIRD